MTPGAPHPDFEDAAVVGLQQHTDGSEDEDLKLRTASNYKRQESTPCLISLTMLRTMLRHL